MMLLDVRVILFIFCKQNTAYEMRISDWSSDVCSSDLVAEAQRSRAPIQAVADRVSGWFVPGVVLVAVATFVIWMLVGPEPRFGHALLNAIAVLIIACPCALDRKSTRLNSSH